MTKIPAPLKWLVVSVALQASVFAAPAKPNVILIVTDDQGYADVGCYGGEGVETPNLDRLAAQGARFTDYYAANSVCSPSRASILTGRYATRCGVPEVLGPGAGKYLKGFQLGLPPGETTIAELLKEAGYATACIGKWHLGHEERYLPTRQGFDEFFGQPYSNDMPIDPLHAKLAEDIKLNGGATRGSIQAGDHAKEKTCPSGQPTDNPEEFHTPLMIGDEVVEFPVDQETLTERYTDEAIAFMDRSAGKPFFIYLAHTMPHVPLAATEAFRSGKPRAGYADTIKELDHNIGRLLDHLEKTGSANNTLVMFTSDNGPLGQSPAFGGSARPLKGFKFQTHEGGQRVPFIVRWPSVVPAGEVISQVTSALDILPTVAAATGIAVPKNIDGTSLLPRAAVFDTPAWVWTSAGDRCARAAASFRGQTIVSATSLWEVSMLVSKGRLELLPDLDTWIQKNLEPPVELAPLSPHICTTSTRLPDFHGDPADRIIVATAISLGVPLITADQTILEWNEKFSGIQTIPLPQEHLPRLQTI